MSLQQFQSTHPVWGATPAEDSKPTAGAISIHAPRMGCDRSSASASTATMHFNPRTPYGVRRDPESKLIAGATFQSTHPVWGATTYLRPILPIQKISIHAPRMGCDPCPQGLSQDARISIHAPRMGCDYVSVIKTYVRQHFNPRTPYGVRLASARDRGTTCAFQSTHPVWGATHDELDNGAAFRHFNPRTPYGVRRTAVSFGAISARISIHAPRMGCDVPVCNFLADVSDFNPRTPYGVRLAT